MDYLRHVRAGVTLGREIQVSPQRRLIGLRTRVYSVDSDKNNVAQKLPAL